MRALLILLTLGLISAPGVAAVGDYAVFTPTRDWSNVATKGDYVNQGLYPFAVAYSSQWAECLLLDWDQEVDDILQWMADHPLGGGESYQFELSLVTAYGWLSYYLDPIPGPQRLEVRTLNMTTDWAEGDVPFALGCPYPYGPCWSPNTFAAVNVYAQCYWHFEGYIPTIDFDNCVPWTTHDGTVVEEFRNHPELFRHVNSRHLVVDTTAEGFLNLGTRVSVVLDYDPDHPPSSFPMPVVNDLLYEGHNRGLVLGPRQYWDEAGGAWVGNESWRGLFCTKDQEGLEGYDPAYKPELTVSIVGAPPRLGDANLDGAVDGADYTVWADYYGQQGVRTWSARGWAAGNFNEDYAVNDADYTLWADNYAWSAGGTIPEPGAIWLLLAGTCLRGLGRKK
jgi:hypothetical protein